MPDASKKLSVVVPAYNAERDLRRCLDSLCGQSYVNFEIVCVDDGSVDSTSEIMHEYAGVDSRVRVIHQANAGVSSARNRALEVVQGDIIGFCDADDAYAPGAFELIIEQFRTCGCDVLVSAYEKTKANGERERFGSNVEKVCSARELQELIMYHSGIGGYSSNKFFKAGLLRGMRFDESLSHGEDMYFISRVLHGNPDVKVLLTPGCTYTYYDNADSATRDVSKLLNEQGELKYMAAMKLMQKLYFGDQEMLRLVRATQFRIITANLKAFRSQPHIMSLLTKQAMQSAIDYLLCNKSTSSFASRLLRCLKLLRYLL